LLENAHEYIKLRQTRFEDKDHAKFEKIALEALSSD
jgi:hypothetical protein